MRTTIRLNLGLKGELEEIARSEGTTFTQLIEEAAWDLVMKRRNAAGTRARDLHPLPVFGDPSQRISEAELLRAISDADLDYDLKQARLAGLISDDRS